jgi:hypothetical protein
MEIDSLLQEEPPYGRTPEPSRVSTFATEWKRTGQGARACDATPADFMIDVARLPRSPWNIFRCSGFHRSLHPEDDILTRQKCERQ